LYFVAVALHGFAESREIKRDQIGVRKTHHQGSGSLRQRTSVDELRIVEVRIPVEIIVDGVIDAATTFAAKPEIHGSDTEVVEKCGVIRTGAECVHPYGLAISNLFLLIVVLGFDDVPRAPALPD